MLGNDMPPVNQCKVESCFYNRELACHAPAINVGGEHPMCDTFLSTGKHIARDGNSAVGACHVDECNFNKNLTCHADGILVAFHNDHADCETFTPKTGGLF